MYTKPHVDVNVISQISGIAMKSVSKKHKTKTAKVFLKKVITPMPGAMSEQAMISSKRSHTSGSNHFLSSDI